MKMAQPKTGSVVVPAGRQSSKTTRKKLPNGGARVHPDASKITGKVPNGKMGDMTSKPPMKGSEKDMTARPAKKMPRNT